MLFVIFVIVFMIEQRGYSLRRPSVTVIYFVSLKGLKKGGTRGEGRQGKIGDKIIRSRDHGIDSLAPVPFTESRRFCTELLTSGTFDA